MADEEFSPGSADELWRPQRIYFDTEEWILLEDDLVKYAWDALLRLAKSISPVKKRVPFQGIIPLTLLMRLSATSSKAVERMLTVAQEAQRITIDRGTITVHESLRTPEADRKDRLRKAHKERASHGQTETVPDEAEESRTDESCTGQSENVPDKLSLSITAREAREKEKLVGKSEGVLRGRPDEPDPPPLDDTDSLIDDVLGIAERIERFAAEHPPSRSDVARLVACLRQCIPESDSLSFELVKFEEANKRGKLAKSGETRIIAALAAWFQRESRSEKQRGRRADAADERRRNPVEGLDFEKKLTAKGDICVRSYLKPGSKEPFDPVSWFTQRHLDPDPEWLTEHGFSRLAERLFESATGVSA